MIYKTKKENYIKGKNGELIAKRYLVEKGYIFIESNYSNDIGEIDLIMCREDILVFVEVKLKLGEDYGHPEEMINKNKIKQVKRVAESYLYFNPKMEKQFEKYRLEAVCIVMENETVIKRITHYESLD